MGSAWGLWRSDLCKVAADGDSIHPPLYTKNFFIKFFVGSTVSTKAGLPEPTRSITRLSTYSIFVANIF